MKIGVIGLGRLGKLIAHHLSYDFEIYATDISDKREEAQSIGVTWANIDKVASCDVIIPFVPISEFQKVLVQIKDQLKPHALVIDVCSVKEYPLEIMRKELPESIQILGTHPMFGPDSAKETLFGCKVVLCPERIETSLFRQIKNYLEKHGLRVIESSGKEHDQQIAMTLNLPHLIGRSLMEMKASRLDIDTLGYRRLLKILGVVENDSWQLFEDMNRYNRYAKRTYELFLNSLESVHSRLDQ